MFFRCVGLGRCAAFPLQRRAGLLPGWGASAPLAAERRLPAARSLSKCGPGSGRRLRSCGYRLRCSAPLLCGVWGLPRQASNLGLLHRQADSEPPRKPYFYFLKITISKRDSKLSNLKNVRKTYYGGEDVNHKRYAFFLEKILDIKRTCFQEIKAMYSFQSLMKYL